MPYIGRSTEAFGVRSRFTFLASADDTSVSGNDVNGLPLSFTDGAYVDVFLNGVKLKSGTDYVTTTANTISSLAALSANDEIEVVVFDVFSLADMVSKANGGNFEGRVGFNGGIGGSGGALTLKNTDTSDDSFPVVTLQTGDTDIAQSDVLGRILFQAPDEGTGTDAITSSARIQALSEGDFSSSNNATSIEFRTATSGVVGTAAQGSRLTLQSDANLLLKDMDTADGSSPTITLQTGDTDIAQDDVLGTINFQAPDEGTGTDAILVAAGISAISEGDFSSSSNATKLSFKTGASEAASSKLELSSGGDLSVLTDGASIFFGANSEIELRHVHDDGLILKHVGTGDGKEPSLTFQAGDNDIAQDDVLGSIFFQAPDEGAGTDAVLVAAGIEAVSEGDFSSSSNATKLSFKTGASEAATSKLELSSGGNLSLLTDTAEIKFGADSEVSLIHYHDNGLKLKTNATGDDTFPSLTLQTGQTDIQQDDTLGRIQFQAPDEGTGTDAILIAAEIEAVSEGDFAADNNATTLNFRTGASEGAGVKMKLTSTGRLGIGTTLSETTEELTVKGAGTVASFVGTGGSGAIAIRDDDDSTLAFAVVDGGTFKIQTSGNSYSDKFKIDPTGFVNMPETAAFSVQASQMNNIAINNSTTIQFDQEIFDQNADFNTSNYTFTAPITGRYMLNVNLRMDNVDIDHSYMYMILNTSNRVYEWLVDISEYQADLDYLPFTINVLADMDTSDTAYVQMHIPNAGTNQSDVVGSAKTTFSGFLAC